MYLERILSSGWCTSWLISWTGRSHWFQRSHLHLKHLQKLQSLEIDRRSHSKTKTTGNVRPLATLSVITAQFQPKSNSKSAAKHLQHVQCERPFTRNQRQHQSERPGKSKTSLMWTHGYVNCRFRYNGCYWTESERWGSVWLLTP